MTLPFESQLPVIRLRNSFHRPYDDAIAAARTCYSPDVISADGITSKQRDSIGPLTFNAGHHTIYQHATFEFSLENISRHFVWSVLHSFPFYNSDQQSQRYVRQKEIRAFLPPLKNQGLEIYKNAIQDAFSTYERLAEILKTDTIKIMGDLRHIDRHPHERLKKQLAREADKKAIEVARYVLPVATYTSMVYTCSGLVLHRLWRLMKGGEVPFEAQQVIGTMIDLVRSYDRDFMEKIGDPPLERSAVLETDFMVNTQTFDPAPWDKELSPHRCSKLIDYTQNAEKIISQSIRLTLGSSLHGQSSSELIQLALDPKRNPYRVEKMNLAAHSPVMRSLHHVNYTFLKKLSHTADSQNQRHRTVPGSRPIYQLVDTLNPDYFVPMLIERNPQAYDIYEGFMRRAWKAKNDLLNQNVEPEFASYVLPNATNVRFIESGSLLNLLHKWTQRTCLNAQEEIYHASMEEIEQVLKVHPFLEGRVGPPCVIRNGVVSPRCTEGDRFCGIPVWQQFPKIERRI